MTVRKFTCWSIYFHFFSVYLSSYNGEFKAGKVAIDLNPGKFTRYGWMDIPITEIFNLLSVDLFSDQEFSVSDGADRGRGMYEI